MATITHCCAKKRLAVSIAVGSSEANPASSCNEIYHRNPTSRESVGQYWIKTDEGKFKVTYNMKLKCGGVEGGWMQVVDVELWLM